MIDNGNGRDLPRITRTLDRESGEDLMLVYYPKAGEITINGDAVIRSQGFSDWEGESVFHQAFGSKQYTIATDVLTKLYS